MTPTWTPRWAQEATHDPNLDLMPEAARVRGCKGCLLAMLLASSFYGVSIVGRQAVRVRAIKISNPAGWNLQTSAGSGQARGLDNGYGQGL